MGLPGGMGVGMAANPEEIDLGDDDVIASEGEGVGNGEYGVNPEKIELGEVEELGGGVGVDPAIAAVLAAGANE